MPLFKYTAIDKKTGKEQHALLEAESAGDLRTLLRSRGLLPITMQEASAKQQHTQIWRGIGLSHRISQSMLVLFTRQLSVLIGSGMPLADALNSCAKQSEKPVLANMIMQIRSRVLAGFTLATGLSDYNTVFSDMFIATVRAGETSGNLSLILDHLADYTERQAAIRSKIQQSSVYPIMMVIVSFAILSFLLAYVVPKLVLLFQDNHATLPLVTRVVIAVSHAAQSYGLIGIASVLVTFLCFRRAFKNSRVKKRIHRLQLMIPFVGWTIRTMNTSRYARTLGLLTTAGLPVLEAMQVSCDVVSHMMIKASVVRAREKVREGRSIHQALAETQFFPPMSVHLIASGESSGNLAAMLEKAAEIQEKRVEDRVNQALTLFEPLMTLVMGGMIMIIVLAIMLPIFALTQMVN